MLTSALSIVSISFWAVMGHPESSTWLCFDLLWCHFRPRQNEQLIMSKILQDNIVNEETRVQLKCDKIFCCSLCDDVTSPPPIFASYDFNCFIIMNSWLIIIPWFMLLATLPPSQVFFSSAVSLVTIDSFINVVYSRPKG